MGFDAEMFRKPGQPGLPGPAEQFDRVDPPLRLFFLRARMFGLPVTVLHVYEGSGAAMTVRLAALSNVVDVHSEELARAETVTLLNDPCLFAPSSLIDPRMAWRALDTHRAEVTFANGPHRVSATLVFDDTGDLANFISDDRLELQPDGSFKRLRWSTPMRDYREFDGRRVAARGDAIWDRPEGDFTYGRFVLKEIHYNTAGLSRCG